MRPLLLPFLLLALGSPLLAELPKLRLPVPEAAPPALASSFGERELAELLRNPSHRDALIGKEIDVVGELTLFDKPNPETGLIHAVGLSKTHGTVLYRVWCQLKKPITKDEFDRFSNASFVTLRGTCSVYSRTKAVGSDLWFDINVTLAEGSVVYWSEAQE